MIKLNISLIWITVFLSFGQCVKVSFYGASYIAMPIQEAKISTNIRLRFRTHQDSSLIFLAAGRTDYCLLSVDEGRIKLIYKIDNQLTELWSPENLLFNDLTWHDIAISRYDANITMQVNEHSIKKNLPEKTTELNIHFGVFIGGLGDFSETYLNDVESFRGCISDVYYNNINVFKRARERSSHVTSVKVSWNCAAEFDASVQESISFIEDDAYMMFSKATQTSGENWNFELRTIEPLATILYNTGTSSRPDFLSLEIIDNKLRLLVGKGANAVELISDKNITDGKWHNISIAYSPSIVEIFVDDTTNTASFANGSSQIIALSNEFYIGGIDKRVRKRAVKVGASDISFRGCLRNIFAENQQVGFPNMKVTQGVTVDCVWKYPCMEKQPCIISGQCEQYGIDEFICSCDQAYCIKADYTDKYKIFTSSSLRVQHEILSVSPIFLLEGDSIFLTPAFIDVLIDYKKMDISESGVLFHIIQSPKCGKIVIQNGNDDINNTISKFFSLIDLSTDKVKYIHNGQEQFSDHLTIDLQFVTKSGDNLIDLLQGRHRFVLHVNITPVNDAPTINIPNNRILRLTQGIPKIIGPNLLSANDPDSQPTSLIFSLISLAENESKFGSIEVAGKASTTFTQYDINQGLVSYLVNSQNDDDTSFEIVIQVSDGMETSQPVTLPISIHPLQLRMINNSGLVLVHKSSSNITPWNLSFISNTEDDSVNVLFEIVQSPQYGSIQKIRSVDSSWIGVDTFTSSQIALGQIRYIHTTDLPIYDEFKFTASLGPIKSPKYDFRLTFTKLSIGIQRQINFNINGTQEIIISCDYLFHQTVPLLTYTRNIIYKVIAPPKYGFIYVEGHPGFAKEMDSFTQQDIDRNLIRYKTYQTSYSSFIDIFEFSVSVSECESIEGKIFFNFTPIESLVKQLSYQARNIIQVNEGDRSLLSKTHFDVLFNKFNFLIFTISEPPKYGFLCFNDQKNSKILKIETFTLENLYLGDIYYCHDDSESISDTFSLLILSDPETDFQYVCDVQAEIKLENDNKPVRTNEKTFNIVRSETKILSSNDLKYIDPDMNTSSTEILYTHISVTNGQFFKAGYAVDTFSQDDLDYRKILFKHSGADYGRALFIVTDGLYKIDGELIIQASDPFLKILESNASIVQENKMIVIRSEDLPIETNLNTKPEDIEFTILNGPSYGILKILRRKFNGTTLPKSTNVTSIKNFTQLDIDKERLIYWNLDVASMDKIKYRISTKQIWTEGEILIRIYPSAYWDLLEIRRNQTLYVEESTSVIISRDVLEIIHPHISPGDITYLVSSSPKHGYLEIQSVTSDDEYNCKVFDQSTINAEKMFYIQAAVNQSTDYFVFDVTNGITWLRNLILKIVIIPENIYMNTQKIIVEEGKTISLNPNYMLPLSEYYTGKILEYKILQQPTFGQILSGKSKVNRFTQKQLEGNVIFYVHDGSENSTDIVKLIAVSRGKESLPFDLLISILPINDEMPQIVTNTGVHMWIGGKSIIKKTDLMAQDYDSPPDSLRFIIKQIRGGHVALKDSLKQKIYNFTQLQINNEEIYFVHDSNHQDSGHMRFFVTDGAHNSTEQTLLIQTNPVQLEEIKNEYLHVFPMTRKQILPEQLYFRCTDDSREIKYLITISPQMGRILYENIDSGMTIEVYEFTQTDINNGRILYEHTHPMAELKSNDTFYFDVSAYLANSLMDQLFFIDISVSTGGLLRFLPVPKLLLDEGDSVPIKLDLSKVLEYLETRAGIQSPELYIESFTPAYGTIEIFGMKTNNQSFTLNDFNSGKVIYRHDHSDTTEDKIYMSVFLIPGQIFLCNLTIPVIINPINDQPFQLITKSPHIEVIEGENRTITKRELLTDDADTLPRDIIYDIISNPTVGVLLKLSDENVPLDIITYGNQFTQEDINDNRIIFVHSGIPQSTSFYFSVTDGKFKPSYEIFNITLVPIIILNDYQNDEIIVVQQGSNTGTNLEPRHIGITTNVNRHRLMYNITRVPLLGVILFNNQTIINFTQDQLENNQIIYKQINLTKSNDTFQVNVYVSNTQYNTYVDIIMNVEPFMAINPITVLTGEKIRLGSTMQTDPNKLKLNRYNPKITIIKRPKLGVFKRIIRNSGKTQEFDMDLSKEDDSKDITSFTFKELKSGTIYFVSKKIEVDFISINDSFEYSLTMKSVQPAQKIVPIEIYSHNRQIIQTNQDINVIVDVAKTTFPINYLIIILAIVTFLALLLLIVIFIKCRAKYSIKNLDKDPPLPLPRPPDLMMINNNRMYLPSEIDSLPQSSTPVLSNVPNCKVYPISLETDDVADSETDELDIGAQHITNTGKYPYYGEDSEEWSSTSCGNEVSYKNIAQPQQNKTNPLLRRNQYWV